MVDKTYKLVYRVSEPYRTDSGGERTAKGLTNTFSTKATSLEEAKKQLKNSTVYQNKARNISNNLDSREHRGPRLSFEFISEQRGKSKAKVLKQSARHARIHSGGGGRAAAALDSGRGGLSKSLTAKKIIPNT
tara:strand:- start:54 stop:452 length:399 start_codon:yes stop_codon:yes gene_type:complete